MNNRPVVVGQIMYGINNIYSVLSENRIIQCRIKGKVLKTEKKYYNPLAVGDFVEIRADPISEDMGWITQCINRKSILARWNKKRTASQIIAANADLLVCVASVQSPPFRPRFIDRLLLSGEVGGLESIIVVNKDDLGVSRSVRERVKVYRKIGYPVIYCSCISGKGIFKLKARIKGRICVFVGQSGAGKSTILNCIDPALQLKVGKISNKYNRGSHTTSYAVMVKSWKNTRLIDTPGIREFEMAGIKPEELSHYFRDFFPYADHCSYYACRHINEPGCAVLEALEKEKIHSDRYESYLRIYDDLKSFHKEYHGSTFD